MSSGPVRGGSPREADLNVDQRVEYWDSLAEYDLVTAETMLAGGRLLYVGFMCHQTVEKALKALHWFVSGAEPERIHSLTRLARSTGIAGELSEGHRDLLDVLDPLNLEARYPTDKERILASLTKERCENILDETRRLFAWLRRKYGR
ncbi:MAG: HEPN domain-containing protein [Acidobacteria bacterium]|nr:HEPN domain-containing protein [Acidobacteriota bacterium]